MWVSSWGGAITLLTQTTTMELFWQHYERVGGMDSSQGNNTRTIFEYNISLNFY